MHIAAGVLLMDTFRRRSMYSATGCGCVPEGYQQNAGVASSSRHPTRVATKEAVTKNKTKKPGALIGRIAALFAI
jgi:hypothetical protein